MADELAGSAAVGRQPTAASVDVLVTVPLNEQFMTRLQGVDPRARVRLAPPPLRRWLRGEGPADAEGQAAVEQLAVEYLDPAQAMVGWARLPKEALTRATRLRWLQTISAGIDRMDPDDYRHLIMTNASGVAAVAMAEYVIGAMLLFGKGFPHMMRRQREHVWDRRFEAREISGKTCGIVGMGAIGGEVARRARAMEMRVIATRRTVTARTSDDLAHELLPASDLPYLLAESDYVVLAMPSSQRLGG
ncbi:MAG: NAD(P)-dependent oxidoreductase [Dehalococcoidia bacterium]